MVMILQKIFGLNSTHGFRENPKMVLDDGGSLLTNYESF
jgi:hypothetical protein